MLAIKIRQLLLIALLAVFTMSSMSFAEDTTPSVKDLLEETERVNEQLKAAEHALPSNAPADDYLRGTPRSSFSGFLKSAMHRDFERASFYLDFRNLPTQPTDDEKIMLAEHLAIILSRSNWIDLETLSNEHLGASDDNLPSYRDRLTRIETDSEDIELYLQRIPRGDGVFIWKISNASVAIIPKLYTIFGNGPVGEWLSKQVPNVTLIGVELWQWIFFLGIFLTAFIVTVPPTWLAAKIFQAKNESLGGDISQFIRGPLRLLIAVIISRAIMSEIHMSAATKAVYEGGTLLVFAYIWVFVRAMDLYLAKLNNKMEAANNTSGTRLLRPIGNSVKFIIITVGLLIWAENLGFKASTILAGLGIGGVAVALAAKNTVENIIGAITLYTSKPIKIGNVCRFGDKVGTVEEIGLRATRIRTLNRSVHHVPNAKLADMELENISERERIRYNPPVRLTYDTTPEQIQTITKAIYAMLEAHEHVNDSPLRVRFKAFGVYALELDVHCYFGTKNYVESLEFAEELNIGIMKIVHEAGSRLATPPNLASAQGGK